MYTGQWKGLEMVCSLFLGNIQRFYSSIAYVAHYDEILSNTMDTSVAKTIGSVSKMCQFLFTICLTPACFSWASCSDRRCCAGKIYVLQWVVVELEVTRLTHWNILININNEVNLSPPWFTFFPLNGRGPYGCACGSLYDEPLHFRIQWHLSSQT